MASTADGSVVISVDLNASEADRELAKLKTKIKKLQEDRDINAEKKTWLETQLTSLGVTLDAEKAKLFEMQSAQKGAFSGVEISEQKLRVRELQSEYNRVASAIDRYGEKIEIATGQIDAMKSEAGGLEAQIFQAEQNMRDIAASATVSDQGIVNLNIELEQLKKRILELRKMGINIGHEEYDRVSQRIAEINQQLKEYKANLSDSKDSAGGMSGAFSEAGLYMDRFNNRIKNLLSRVFVFTLITSALRSLRTWLGNVIKTNAEAQASLARLKGALLTLAQPIISVLIPAITTLLNLLAKLASIAARIVSALFGTTVGQSAKAAKNLYDEQQAIEGVGEAAEEAAGSLAGFDEINTIQTENDKGSGGGGGGASTEGIKPDFSSVIESSLDAIVELFAGLALLALGAILTFSGVNIPLGIALMALGAAFLVDAIATNWGAISEALQGPLGVALAIISGALLVVGAILAFSGANIPLGIALMAIGAIGLATVVAANWDSLSQVLQGPIGTITALLSGALLVIGALLALSGTNIPLGLGLMVAGAAGLATVLAANWDTVQNCLEGPTGAATVLISGSILMLGAILAFSGVALPLGIALMAAGAVGIVASAAANWSTVTNALRGPIGAATGIISAAFLVLGAILLFTGAGIPLGLGLILAGSAGLAAAVAPNWNFILEKIKGAWENVKSWWKGNVSKYLSWEYWKNLGKSMIDGLLAGLKGIFSGLSSWASNVWSSITGAFSSKNAKSSISNSASSGKTRTINIADIPPVESFKIPELARGAVIPPNREFMAVLGDQRSGTNIEAPEDLIRKIVREEAGGNADILRQILQAIKDDRVMVVDKQVLARTAAKGINDLTRQSGRSVLLY